MLHKKNHIVLHNEKHKKNFTLRVEMLFPLVWTTGQGNMLGLWPRAREKERFSLALRPIWLAERRLIEQGVALLIFRFRLDAAHFDQFTRATVRNHFSEAGPTAFGGCGYAASLRSALHLALRVAGRHTRTRLVRLRRWTLLADGGAQARCPPGGPGEQLLASRAARSCPGRARARSLTCP